jgi:Carbohydrate esterase 2 N-terminal
MSCCATDDGTPVELQATAGTTSYTLAINLAPNIVHSVEVVKRTEAYIGTGNFTGFDFGPGGQLLQARDMP